MIELDDKLASGLPFETKQQDALFGYIIKNEGFFLQLHERVLPDWWVDGWIGKAYGSYCKFYKKFNHIPASDEEFMSWDGIYTLDPMERAKIKAVLLRARNETSNYSLDVLKNGLQAWLQTRIYHKNVTESAMLFNARKIAEAGHVLARGVKEFQEINFDGYQPVDYSNPKALVQSALSESSNALTLGHSMLDKALNPDCAKGSMLLGDTTVLMAPTGLGKTTASISVLTANIMNQKPCLYIHHEGRRDDIAEKIWLNMLDVSKKRFRELVFSSEPSHIMTLQVISKLLQDYLIHIDMQKPGLTVEEVVSTIRKYQERLKNKGLGGIALCVNDYPALLNTMETQNVRMERRQKDNYVYRYLVDLMGEQKIHGLFPIQTNREGYKVNRKTGDDHKRNRQLLTLDFVQEAFEVTNSATNLITLNRTPSDAMNELVTWLFAKSRSNEVNIAVTTRSNYRHARTHHPGMAAAMFKGTEMIDNLDSLLTEFSGQEIPYERQQIHGL
jgi:hypothetical protein